MLTYGLRLPPFPRALLLGVVYMALHLVAAVYVHEGVGTNGPGPWLPAGIAMAFLILGGFSLLPFVFVANLLSAYVLLPAASGSVRYLWPLVLCLCWTMAAHEIRRISGLFRPWTLRGTSHFALCALLCSIIAGVLGAALHKSGPNGSVVPLHALTLSIIEPQLMGLLLATPIVLHFGGAFRPRGFPRSFIHKVGRIEFLLQLTGVFLSVWLVAFTDAASWAPGLIFLVWLAVRQGLSWGAIVALLLCVGAGYHRELTLPDMDGMRPILVFELAVCAIGLGLGAWADENRQKRGHLQESCDRMDMLMEHGGVGVWDWQAGSPILFEGAWHNLCSLPPGTSQVGEDVWFSLIHPEDLPRVKAAREAHMRGELPRYELEFRIRSSSGFYRWVLDRGIVMRRDTTGRGTRMVGLCIDLSTRKHTENSQLRFMDLLESASDPVVATDLHGNVFYANRCLLSLHGDNNVAGAQARHISDYFSENSAKLLLRDVLPLVETQGLWWGVLELVDVTGRIVPVSVGISLQKDHYGHARSYGFIMRRMEHVLPERVKSESSKSGELSQVERQEALRLLAGGAVHGFNNVLMAIMGNAFLARKDLPPDAPSRHFFLQIDQATQRGSQLCQSMQLIAGKVHPGNQKIDFNQHIEALLPGLTQSLKRPEFCVFTPSKDLPLCVADAAQLEKLLRHLILNAAEAYGDNPGPIRILTGKLEFDPNGFVSPAPFGALQKGDYVLLEISDEGPGLDPALHSRAFDPFFTTKSGHKGIGLAEVSGIVRGHAGAIRLESSPGAGFTLQLLFPLAQQRPSGLTRPPIAPTVEKWRGAGQVLVIDDEETVREVAASMLENLGFSPLVAKDGMEGLRILRQHADTLKLVLLDYSMPIMDGESTLAEFSKLRPDIPVLFMSGHESRDLRSRVNGGQLAGVLSKPFSIETLQSNLRKALELG